jgi:predicted phage replisome organizer
VGKRYFWLKLRTDFFDSDEMRILSAQEKGSDYIVFWLKLLTRAVQEEQPGRMRYRQDVPYTDSLLAKLLNEDVDVVRSCMGIFQRMGMVVVDEEKTIWVEAATQLVGTETDSAERMRRLRENRDNHLLPSHSDTERHIVTDSPSHSDKDVTRVLQKSDADYISNLSSSSSISLKSKKDKITRETLGEDGELYHLIERGFLEKNGEKFTDYAREGAAIKQLIKRAKARDKENATELLVGVCAAFWKLKTGGDKFWRGQPFTPSTLNTVSLWDRVLESMRADEVDPEIEAIIRGEGKE